MKFFKDKDNKKYVLPENENIVCDVCGNFCESFVILKQFFFKGHVRRFLACSPVCSKKINFVGDFEVGRYFVVDSINNSFSLIQPEKVFFSYSEKISNIDAVHKLDSVKVTDKTVHADREYFDGAQIGISPKEVIEHKDDKVNLKEAEMFLKNLKKIK
jgi:hypothetical protein